jgi:hypothetical protein
LKSSAAEFKDVANLLFQGGRTVSAIVETECVNMRVVQSVPRGQLAFVLLMVVVAVAPTLVVIKVLETSSFVLHMVEGSGVDSRTVTSLQWEVRAFVQPMVVDVGVQ